MTDAGKMSFKVISLAVVAITTTLLIVSLALAGRDTERYPSNVSVAGISIANLSRQEARELLNKDMLSSWGKNLILDLNGKSISVPLEEIGITYDLTATLEKVDKLLYNSEDQNAIWQHSLLRGQQQEIAPVLAWDKEKLYNKLLELKNENDRAAINARILYHNEYLEYIAHKNGYAINVNSSMENTNKVLANGSLGPIKIELNEILSRVRIEDIETVKDILGVNASILNVTADDAKALLDKLNGIILMPEERISLFGAMDGENPTADAKENILTAGIQEQVENSIFKACRQAGLDIDTHRIENNLEHPVLLVLSLEGNTLLVRIIGCKTDPGKEIKLTSKKEELVPQVIIKVNYRLSPQQRVVKQEGKSGWIKRTYRVVKSGEREIEKGLLSEQYFPPTDTIIEVGPGSIRK
ncbi:MAG: peptidoglycan binding domain-containing protein [Syntrophomonadaceae bacterium]|nr:peptidoglycan binding domain-containing protein [Syntrophomonadaceae bacterium]